MRAAWCPICKHWRVTIATRTKGRIVRPHATAGSSTRRCDGSRRRVTEIERLVDNK